MAEVLFVVIATASEAWREAIPRAVRTWMGIAASLRSSQ
jgi:hypothetical protein